MQLTTLDWGIILAFFALSLLIGLLTVGRSGRNFSEFFLSGRGMPWWLLGVSMVATTFSADTPNLVTDIVRQNGIAGNWVWWAFLLTGMLTVFVYAKLWRRSGILTDLEFYEMRYSGVAASFLRGFRAVYLGVVFNVFIMATVSLAAIKIGGVLLGLSPVQTVVIASLVTVIYTSLGGLRSVIWTDFFQFGLAMIGMVWAAYEVLNLPQVGGLSGLLANPAVSGKLNFLPDFNNSDLLIPLFILPLAVQWWSVWYPGAEPGGGGYVVQRMLSAKNEKHAIGATLFFNIAHYALRPWPWLLIALASLIVFPTLGDLKTAFPNVSDQYIRDDLAFPAMLTLLKPGLVGLVAAGLIAAYMSTISTHLNWGSSYVVNDVYRRFIKPEAGDKELVNVGRISTVVLMIISALLALALESALGAFNIILQIGAGTGLIFILRWFWWRINAYSELAAMIISFLIAIYFQWFHPGDLSDGAKLVIGVLVTTIGWLVVTFLTRPTDERTLLNFYKLIRPHAAGWQPVIQRAVAEEELSGPIPTSSFALELSCMIAGCFLVYGALFASGFLLYGQYFPALVAGLLAAAAAIFITRNWVRVQ